MTNNIFAFSKENMSTLLSIIFEANCCDRIFWACCIARFHQSPGAVLRSYLGSWVEVPKHADDHVAQAGEDHVTLNHVLGKSEWLSAKTPLN